jgi:signal transduction histidine kinase
MDVDPGHRVPNELHEQFQALLSLLRDAVPLSRDLDAELDDFADRLAASPPPAAIAHDLRAPVGALRHQVELLADPDLPDDLRARCLAAIERNADDLAATVDQLGAATGPVRMRRRYAS